MRSNNRVSTLGLTFISVLLIFCLVSCTTDPASAAAEAKKTFVNCQTDVDRNLYLQPSRSYSAIEEIYEKSYLSSIDPARPPDLLAAQEQTLGYLMAQVRNWSHHRDLGEAEKARITVTFLHPDLMRTILFAQMLNSVNTPTGVKTVAGITDDIKKVVDGDWGKKNRLVFLMTVTALPETNPKVSLPIEKIELVSMVGKTIPPERMDGNLGFNIFPSQPDVHFGYVMFYGGIMGSGDVCTSYIDPSLDTSLTVRIPEVVVNEDKTANVFWFEPLRAVLPVEQDISNSLTRVPFPNEPGFIGLMEPPLPDFGDPVGSDLYWRQMAQFIWGKSIELGLGK